MDEDRNVPKSPSGDSKMLRKNEHLFLPAKATIPKVTLTGNVTTSAYACTSYASAAGVLVPPGERDASPALVHGEMEVWLGQLELLLLHCVCQHLSVRVVSVRLLSQLQQLPQSHP